MNKIDKIQAVKGMKDCFAPESSHWLWLETKLHDWMRRYGHTLIRTPILEHAALFVRGLGDVTDVVEKEMYTFTDALNGDQLCLRPENTAGVVRAAIEHHLTYDAPKRLYYTGPMFRHEAPQRGRYRQFHQWGVEALGFSGPDVDAEIITLACDLWQDLGLTNITLQINTLGAPEERLQHRQALIDYLSRYADSLDADAQRRLHTNPLRTLDSKNPKMQALLEQAPTLMHYLGTDSRRYFDQWCDALTQLGISFEINPRLVRGLDYYHHGVFEFVTTSLGSQGTVCAGGRYDGLFAQLGGKPTPAVGWAMGMERILELLKEQQCLPASEPIQIYAMVEQAQDLPQIAPVLRTLRQAGWSVQCTHQQPNGTMPSFKAQFKRADASQAPLGLIFGSNEWQQGEVSLKWLRTPPPTPTPIPIPSETAQWRVPVTALLNEMKRCLSQ